MLNALKAGLLFNKGQKLFKAGKSKDGIDLYDRAINLSPGQSGIHLHKAIALAEEKKYQAAIAALQQAISLKPDNSAQHLWLGILYFDLDQMDNAVEQFDRALAVSSDNDLVLSFKYLALMQKGHEMNHNCTSLLERVEYTNTLFKARLLLFCESHALQNKKRARFLNDTIFHDTYLKNMSESKVSGIHLFQNPGHAFNRVYTNIVFIFTPAKKQTYLRYLKAIKMLKSGKFDRAASEFNTALKTLPAFEEARSLLIDLHLYQKNVVAAFNSLKAVEDYKKIAPVLYSEASIDDKIDELGNHLNLILALGITHFYADEYDKAIKLLKFISNFSDSYFDDYYLGLSYLGQGDSEQALSCFQDAMRKLNPAVASSRLREVQRLIKAQP